MDSLASLQPEYEVVIVGGRPAGASLAARLGAQGVSTLVIDKATFPSLPSVPSCGVLYPQTTALLDELEIDEQDYCGDDLRIRRFVMQISGAFHSVFPMVQAHGRDYLCGIDRARFDAAVRGTLDRQPTVAVSDGVSFTDLVRDDDGQVTGVRILDAEGEPRTIRARAVIGADGRFSTVARKAGARVLEDYADRTSTAHFASWEDVAPFDDDPQPSLCVYTTMRGIDVLFFPTGGGRVFVCTHQRSDRVRQVDDPLEFYLRTIERVPEAWRRLQGAKRNDDLVGLRRVGNRLLEPGGPGWALVGDAIHHKDPVDGQGIYDALLGSKILAEELQPWRKGKRGWDEMVARYDRRFRDGTHGMFMATMGRLRRELYDEPPTLVIHTLLRWMLTDDEYRQQFLGFLCRTVPPDRWLTPGLMGRTALRGMLRDMRRVFRRSGAA
ncbi:NAD(P)/FAD-dependent oxidoreductase [Paraliomyxa miuraensis]|uniref:NAD(P)/FAD-dependent oxidoreductase n=1 Tax=Paraliomyxa miuraensis TaxID=376150 RepID=UPI00224E1173|nr:NAD(P)/FAD-dependent oxidoreductase [Paraliomyxa miuraensis]MCX4247690.1 NAD(P)/FAD-dependent oxidoreductase [Paraliomyxa miuraensis]